MTTIASIMTGPYQAGQIHGIDLSWRKWSAGGISVTMYDRLAYGVRLRVEGDVTFNARSVEEAEIRLPLARQAEEDWKAKAAAIRAHEERMRADALVAAAAKAKADAAEKARQKQQRADEDALLARLPLEYVQIAGGTDGQVLVQGGRHGTHAGRAGKFLELRGACQDAWGTLPRGECRDAAIGVNGTEPFGCYYFEIWIPAALADAHRARGGEVHDPRNPPARIRGPQPG